ncbi:hypothetical protein H0194_07925 [Corynebacterium incognita]|uniref:Transposase n=1 Tax=Corynebacterium incognita TaxID=2754725 RepID=A0A7G7CN38_9CORY|nr:hypothetical protein [Corynebacterium incognita]QNE89004.1 hypothetical protein H0194_07925 [Corynebacterium incognita]
MDAPGMLSILAAGYGLFLLAVGWGFDLMAQKTANRTTDMHSGTFRYLEEHDAWQCPEDQWLWPSSFDPENRVMRYRATPTVCNTCPVKETCTVSSHGRELTRQLDPWPHSDSGHFHRGIALAVVCMGYLLPLSSLITNHATSEILLTAAVCLVLTGAGVIPLARHLWTTPSNAPTTVVPDRTDREEAIELAVDRYSSKYGKNRYASTRVKETKE